MHCSSNSLNTGILAAASNAADPAVTALGRRWGVGRQEWLRFLGWLPLRGHPPLTPVFIRWTFLAAGSLWGCRAMLWCDFMLLMRLVLTVNCSLTWF